NPTAGRAVCSWIDSWTKTCDCRFSWGPVGKREPFPRHPERWEASRKRRIRRFFAAQNDREFYRENDDRVELRRWPFDGSEPGHEHCRPLRGGRIRILIF